jgi:iodotyrosine deiodinase
VDRARSIDPCAGNRSLSSPEPPRFVPFSAYDPGVEAVDAAATFNSIMQQRRSVRFFADTPVEQAVIESIIATAGSAPSGANKQPWRFVAIQDPSIKRDVREAAEAEETTFYASRASERWLEDLHPFGTDANKPFLETAPWLIAVFKLARSEEDKNDAEQVYYANESVGIACGFLLAAIHNAGLVALTHTPSPMGFLASILRRPSHERAFLLIPVGYPAADCVVPAIKRKGLDEIMVIDRPAAQPSPPTPPIAPCDTADQ